MIDYFEFIRYTNCEYDETYESYKLIEDYQYGYNFKMEYYSLSSKNFDKFVDQVLNAIGWKFDSLSTHNQQRDKQRLLEQ